MRAARAVARYAVARPYGGWPQGMPASDGLWRPTPNTTFTWKSVADRTGTAFRLRTIEPFTDPALQLRTDVHIVDRGEQTYIAVETFAVSTVSELTGTVAYENTAPGFVATLVEKVGVVDGPFRLPHVAYDMTAKPENIGEIVAHPDRRLPVLVVVDPQTIGGAGLDLTATAFAGLGYVIGCDRATATVLHEEFRVDLPAPNQAGLFWPRYSPGSTDRRVVWGSRALVPSEHGVPCWPAIRTVYAAAAIRLNRPDDFERIETAALRQRLVDAEASERTSAEFDELLVDWEKDLAALDETRAENDVLAAEVRRLRTDLDATIASFDEALEAQRERFAAATPAPVQRVAETASFRTLREAVDAAAKDAKHLVILPDAYESAERCAFARPNDLYDDLMRADTIAGLWVNDQLDPAGITATALQHGLVWRSGISQTAEGQYAADYLVTYNGDEVMLGPHFGRGANSSNHYRAYVHLDREQRLIVVGYIGKHLRDSNNR